MPHELVFASLASMVRRAVLALHAARQNTNQILALARAPHARKNLNPSQEVTAWPIASVTLDILEIMGRSAAPAQPGPIKTPLETRVVLHVLQTPTPCLMQARSIRTAFA